MSLSSALLLLSLCGCVSCVQYEASFSMAGVTGRVEFDLLQKNITINLFGTKSETCGAFNLSLTEFPVMYGHVSQPCESAHIGDQVLTSPLNMDTLTNLSSLDGYSLLVETCSGARACAGILAMSGVTTLQARFYGKLAGNIYLRRVWGELDAVLLSDLVYLNGSDSSVADIYAYKSSAPNCQALMASLNSSSLKYMGRLKIGTPQRPVKSRLKVPSDFNAYDFALFNFSSGYLCAKFRILEGKTVSAVINMRGQKGYLEFSQKSPFNPTHLTVNISNHNLSIGHYHVHLFPTQELQLPSQKTCSNDNLGGHWNPFGVDTQASKNPPPQGLTHDMYEVGDLSGRHGSLEGYNDIHLEFFDYNLPLFGQNSIVGRSVVLHELDGTRFACASIGYPGEVLVARAVFQAPVVGSILFTQLKTDPYSDVSVFLDLSYGRVDVPATQKHHWHIHTHPISTEMDTDLRRCGSTGGHWNPYMINNSASSYQQNCKPDNPFSCEIGDLSRKHKLLSLAPNLGKLPNKNFFTDTTSWVSGPDGMLSRSVVIHGPDEAGLRLACANITLLRFPEAWSRSWEGPGSSRGHVHFFQASPQGPTNVNVSLVGLKALAGGYHVHVLPVKSGVDACSNKNVMGHFNPHGVNASASPQPGNGTVDQYEVGDISGKFGTLKDRDELMNRYLDGNMPLSGPNSIIGRSLVIHYKDGSRMQCANIRAVEPSDGYGITARVMFTSSVTGTVTLFQQSFPDGSYSDVTLLVDINASKTLVSEVSWYITEDHKDGSMEGCTGSGRTYNPFNMTDQNPGCSLSHLVCEVGDLTSKHGSISLTQRQLYTDTNLQLAGDFTVVYRSLVLKVGNKTIACADILPESPSAQQIFPVVSSFSRYDFRKRVADVLQVHLSRVSILPGALTRMPEGKCQQVTFLVSGEVDQTKLASVKRSKKMGAYKQTKECTRSGVSDLLSFCSGGVYTVSLAVIYLLHILQ